MATKISFVSLGCDKNLIDSEIMLGLIDEKGYILHLMIQKLMSLLLIAVALY